VVSDRDVLSAAELAQMAGRTVATVYTAVRKGRLRSLSGGGGSSKANAFVFERAEAERWLAWYRQNSLEAMSADYQRRLQCECGNPKDPYAERCRRCSDVEKWNNPPASTAPELEPGPLEIGYAAGFFEGEGSADCKSGALRVTLPQLDPQPLEYLRRYFGGNLNGPYAHGMHYLYITGKRAWDFLVLIAPLLSDRRMDQLTVACVKVHHFERKEVVLCDRSIPGVHRRMAREELSPIR
jgi:hypothetical protein